MTAIMSFLKHWLDEHTHSPEKVPMDKQQLDAALMRHTESLEDFTAAKDELSAMLKRLKESRKRRGNNK